MSSRQPRIRIVEANGVRTMKFVRAQQSSMRLDDPFETDFDYPGYLHIPMAVAPDATRTLVVGLGGGTVVKRYWRDYPAMHVDAVEIDADVVEACRSQFALPDDPRIEVHVSDGRSFVESSSSAWDIIIIDAFDDDVVPLPLMTEEFVRMLRDHLSNDGAVAYNVTGSIAGDKSKPFRSFYKTVANVFSRVWVFPIGMSKGGPASEHRNIIVVATDARLSADQLVERLDRRAGDLVTVPSFDSFSGDLLEQKVRTGDVALLLDPRGRGR